MALRRLCDVLRTLQNLRIIFACWNMPAATCESQASLVAGPLCHVMGSKARGGLSPMSSYTSPLALGQQARALWGLDSPRHQFWTHCIVADMEMLTTPC